MYHYLQYRPDKKEAWRFVSAKQIDSSSKPPAYISVLQVDKEVGALEDAGEDVLESVKYKGPMYFDLDNANDITQVLESSRDLLGKIRHQLGVPDEYIQCWLSGGKGVHFTINEKIFGVKRAVKYLPYIYLEIAKQVEVPNLDMGVYSAGRGRLWRCPGVARPGTGTYKVPVSLDELEAMDAETYAVLCAQPRTEGEPPSLPDNVSIAKAELAFKQAKQAAGRRIRAIKNAKVVPTEELRQLEEIPGCIQTLITQGDCGDSNWNQAAMQVAAWIAARYTREEETEYTETVIDPFITHVESSTRPSETERRKHVKDQINRAFSGKTAFAVGPLIKTIGQPCDKCPLCRGDISFEEPRPTNKLEDFQFFDKDNKIVANHRGYLQYRGDNPARVLTTFTFWPHTLVKQFEETSLGVYQDQGMTSMIGTLICGNSKRYDYRVPTDSWSSSGQMRKTINSTGGAVPCGDADLQLIYHSINNEVIQSDEGVRDGIDTMAEVSYCGIILEKQRAKGGVVKHIPHYVEEKDAITPTRTGSVKSKFRYAPSSKGQGDLCPHLLGEEFPFVDDTDLEDALNGLFKMNEPASIAKSVGWLCATFLKEHLHQLFGQFPLLGIWGNASAGKSMTAYTLCSLAGMDYLDQAQALNMETATSQPLREFVASSSTVPRLIEELNFAGVRNKGVYTDAMGVLKAAYNSASIQRGGLSKMTVTRVKSPILYISEQRPNQPSVRNRTIEVMLTATNREKEGRSDAFGKAFGGRNHFRRAAKAMLDTSLRLSLAQVSKMFEDVKPLIPDAMDERPGYNLRVCLLGLDFLQRSLQRFEVDVSAQVAELKNALQDDLGANYRKIEQSLRRSEVDMVLSDFDQMASEADQRDGLQPGQDYLRRGNWLSLDVARCFNRYRRYSRSMGQEIVFQRADSLCDLLSGEMYFDRLEKDVNRTHVNRYVLDIDKMRKKGIPVDNFKDTEA
jgi:hypothetical protein